jgi:hypothetical protein
MAEHHAVLLFSITSRLEINCGHRRGLIPTRSASILHNNRLSNEQMLADESLNLPPDIT